MCNECMILFSSSFLSISTKSWILSVRGMKSENERRTCFSVIFQENFYSLNCGHKHTAATCIPNRIQGILWQRYSSLNQHLLCNRYHVRSVARVAHQNSYSDGITIFPIRFLHTKSFLMKKKILFRSQGRVSPFWTPCFSAKVYSLSQCTMHHYPNHWFQVND